ncbi:unnamed protein product [Effrenium voratum]|uniref:Fe2OG dioxygenase domain-containing protein n=1 Tax=Effrenium voratum TaxID=2562239 RepID=A0AA36N6R9_9DINO|nr:unnamed protein product [Effrenium voratum]CAJ1394594.1 unnamed protein product [Effrenium voratum]CAJ1438961.1 unnamed protein product [Effrenium voratum]CAJ1450012.1 unnamed protein product [Effrenium voratum]
MAVSHSLRLGLLALAGSAGIFLCWKRYLAQRDRAIARAFQKIKSMNKAIALVVSDARNASFSRRNLSKYMVQRGLCPSEDLLRDATLLVSLLEESRGPPAKFAHELKQAAIDAEHLQRLFPEIQASYVQQPLDYGRNSRYGDNWRISCYMVVMENWKPKIMPHEPMLRCLGDTMQHCVAQFEAWYCTLKGFRQGSKRFSVMNAFVTRYRPVHGEDELQKHIDGANVDGSVILALPTEEPFEGGALHVWDGKPKQELVYQMAPGDCMFMDTKIWHQAKPISKGARWALVLFLKLEK